MNQQFVLALTASLCLGCLPQLNTTPSEGPDASSDASSDTSSDVEVLDTGDDTGDAGDAGDVGDAEVTRVACQACAPTTYCMQGERCSAIECQGACSDGESVCASATLGTSSIDPSLAAEDREHVLFGHNVAVSGDGLTAAISSGFGDGTSSFLAVVDVCGAKHFLSVSTADGQDSGSDTGFGDSLALSGDGTTLAVGERLWGEGSNIRSGRVLIYKRAAPGLMFTDSPTVLAPAPKEMQFGSGLALSPGGDQLLVTALNPTGKGELSAWDLSDVEPTLLGLVEGGENEGLFGRSLAVSWSSRVAVVGAPKEQESRGAVHFIDFKSGWTNPAARLLAVNAASLQAKQNTTEEGGLTRTGSHLGTSVGMSSGGEYIVAGAPNTIAGDLSAGGEYREGKAFVWKQTSDQSGYLQPIGYRGPAGEDSAVGGAVAISADGIGWATASQWKRIDSVRLFVGSGALFKIDTTVEEQSETTLVTPEFEADYDEDEMSGTYGLGTAMSLSGDGRFLIVGAQTSDIEGVTNSGAAVIFNVPQSGGVEP